MAYRQGLCRGLSDGGGEQAWCCLQPKTRRGREGDPIIEGKAEIAILKDDGHTGAGPPWLPDMTFVRIFVGILGALHGAILWDLILQWGDDPNYSHGFLVPFSAASDLAAARNAERRSVPARKLAWATRTPGGDQRAGDLGDLGAELFLMRSSLIVIITGLILLHLGTEDPPRACFSPGLPLFHGAAPDHSL